jgi:hypothetical protein
MLLSLDTPPARFELATNRLTVDRSTTELQGIMSDVFTSLLPYH